jgi:hypothetical protein
VQTNVQNYTQNCSIFSISFLELKFTPPPPSSSSLLIRPLLAPPSLHSHVSRGQLWKCKQTQTVQRANLVRLVNHCVEWYFFNFSVYIYRLRLVCNDLMNQQEDWLDQVASNIANFDPLRTARFITLEHPWSSSGVWSWKNSVLNFHVRSHSNLIYLLVHYNIASQIIAPRFIISCPRYICRSICRNWNQQVL